MLTNHQKCCLRDNTIQTTLENWGALDILQLQTLYFPSLRMAQKRLLRLYKRKKVYRTRLDTLHYCYYIDKPGMIAHRLGVNWIKIYLMRSIKHWEQLTKYEYEPNYNVIRPDALALIKNTYVTPNKHRLIFIELDLSDNPFDKIEKYNDWYNSKGYTKSWWVDYVDRFPQVWIVTNDPVRLLKIQDKIRNENKYGLEFQVYLLDDIVRRVVQ